MSNANASAQMPASPALPMGLVATALALGTFMQVLDTTIANVSIPTIAGNLGVSPNQGTWVITSFAVANGISVPLTGWLMMRFGVVRTFVVSVLLFTLASFLCGIAWSLESLILFRILQGAVSGPMIPGSQALLLSLFPPHKKGSALAIWSMTTLVAPICGPILGGYISDNYSWPWIFLINVPVGIFCGYVCWKGLKARETPTKQIPVDSIGLGLLGVWVGALQIFLDKGKELDWFHSQFIVVTSLIALVGFIAFLVWELGEKHPIINLGLFKNRNFTIGTLALCLGYGIFFGAVVLQPLWMQTWLGYTATWAGFVAAPSGVVAVIIAPWVGKNITRFDARLFATISFIIFGTSYFMRSGYTADASFGVYVAPLLVQGIAMAIFFVAMLSILLDGVPEHQIPAASGLSNFLRIVAGAFATSICTTFWDDQASVHQTRMAEASSIYDVNMQQTLHQMNAAGFSDQQALGLLTHQMSNQAHLMSIVDFFWIAGWLCWGIAGIVWLTRRPQGAGHAVAAD